MVTHIKPSAAFSTELMYDGNLAQKTGCIICLIKGCIRETPNPGIMNTGNRLLLPVFGILLDVHCSNRGYSGKSILRSSNSLMVFGKYSEIELKLSKKTKRFIYIMNNHIIKIYL